MERVVKEGKVQELTGEIYAYALSLGFTGCGFSRVRDLSEYRATYETWIQNGYHAGMEYMERNTDKRFDPALLSEGAKTVISLLFNYYSADQLKGSPLKIARYAYGTDYHEVLKEKLFALDLFIRDRAGDVTQRCFVDSAPVLERAWAQNSGLGWIGKNSCLISRKHGSFVFIAEIITSLELEYDEPMHDYCGSCRKCIDACPTHAITEHRTLNSHKCISYQTIENRSEIPESLKGRFENYIFGCDICQEVCPWNRKAQAHQEPLFRLRREIADMSMENWISLDLETYQRIFRKSAVKRAKFGGIKRNIAFVTETDGN